MTGNLIVCDMYAVYCFGVPVIDVGSVSDTKKNGNRYILSGLRE